MAYLKVVGMPQSFWVVTAPTPNSRLSDICFLSNFKMLAAYLRGESGMAPRRILGFVQQGATPLPPASRYWNTLPPHLAGPRYGGHRPAVEFLDGQKPTPGLLTEKLVS